MNINWTKLGNGEIPFFTIDDSDADAVSGASEFGADCLCLDAGANGFKILDNSVLLGVDPVNINFEAEAYGVGTIRFGFLLGARVNASNKEGYYFGTIPSGGAGDYLVPRILKFQASTWSSLGTDTIVAKSGNGRLRFVAKVSGSNLELEVFDGVTSVALIQITDGTFSSAGKVVVGHEDVAPLTTFESFRVYADNFKVNNLTGA